jgi:hypothetical protein
MDALEPRHNDADDLVASYDAGYADGITSCAQTDMTIRRLNRSNGVALGTCATLS